MLLFGLALAVSTFELKVTTCEIITKTHGTMTFFCSLYESGRGRTKLWTLPLEKGPDLGCMSHQDTYQYLKSCNEGATDKVTTCWYYDKDNFQCETPKHEWHLLDVKKTTGYYCFNYEDRHKIESNCAKQTPLL